jgi:hypothetical protein
MCCGEAFHSLGFRLLRFDFGWYFISAWWRRSREGKKKIIAAGKGFPRGWTHLAGCAEGCSC